MMRKMSRTVATVALVVLLVAMVGPAALYARTTAQDFIAPVAGVDTVDDEVILVQSNGYIKVEDPHTDIGEEPAIWTSPEAGWTSVATADFNGDGDDEIIALGGSKLKIFDPFPKVGASSLLFQLNVSPQTWFKALGGDVDGDGRAELVALQNDNADSIKAHLYVYDGNAAGTSWSKIVDLAYGLQWADITLGNFLGDGRDKIVMSRPEDSLMLTLDGQTGQEITRATYGSHFFRLNAGDFDEDGRDELAALREVLTPFANLVIFKLNGVGQGYTSIHSLAVGAVFRWEAAGDFDNDGADELVLLRNLDAPYKGLFSVDLSSPLIAVDEVIGQGWTDIQAGDLDGSGFSRALILKDNQVRAYSLAPAISIVWQKSGAYASSFATGNVDGRGIVSGPTLNAAPTMLSFQMVARGSNPAPQTVTLSNTSTADVIHWTAAESPATEWLNLSATSGVTPGSFQVSINGAAAPAGASQARIVVSSGDAGVLNIPITITVNLNVTAPTLVVTPNRLPAKMARPGKYVPAEVVQVRQGDGGSGAIDWVAAVIYKDAWDDLLAHGDAVKNVRLSANGLDAEVDGQAVHLGPAGWLTLSAYSGSTPFDIVVDYNTAGLSTGRHEATIIVDAGSGVISRIGYCDVVFTSAYANMLPVILK